MVLPTVNIQDTKGVSALRCKTSVNEITVSVLNRNSELCAHPPSPSFWDSTCYSFVFYEVPWCYP